MDAHIQLITIFASGLLGLLVAVVTVALTASKESRTERRALIREKRTQLENLYTDNIAVFEKCIRYTESREPFSDLYNELARINARMRLLSVMDVIQESEAASDLIHQWSGEYRAGMPKPIDDTGITMISSHDSPHRKKAKELYPQLHDQINKMIAVMQNHLESVDPRSTNAT